MKLGELKLGKTVEFIITREEFKLRLVSKIEEVKEDRIFVSLIQGNGRVLLCKDTDQVQMIYKDEGNLYVFSNLYGKLGKLNDEYVHVFYGKSKGVVYNRRNAFRILVGEEGRFSWTVKGNEVVLHDFREMMHKAEGEKLTKGCACLIKDISEDGTCIATDEVMEVSNFISFQLITSVGKIRCIGEVVRVSRNKEGKYSNEYGIKFTEVSSIISKYIYTLQRLQLKKKKQ